MLRLQVLGFKGVDGGQGLLEEDDDFLEFWDNRVLWEVSLALIDDSEVLVDTLDHGFDLYFFKGLFFPLLLQHLEILNTLPERVPQIKLLLQRVKRIIITITIDLQDILKLQHPLHFSL